MRDAVIASPGGAATMTPNRAVIRRSDHSVISRCGDPIIP
jgi:hypothetical protein